MKKTLLAATLAAALPLAAVAQAGPGPGEGAGPGPGGMGPGMMRGQGGPGGPGAGPHDHRRAKLALTLGLAEALDLDDAQALKLRGVVDQFEAKRAPLMQQQQEAMKAVRQAADAEKPDAAGVDQSVAKLLEARDRLHALDRELVQAIVKDLPAQKKARAVLFLGRFHQRMQKRMGPAGRGGHQRHRMDGRPGAGPTMGMLDAPPPMDGAGGDEPGFMDDEEP